MSTESKQFSAAAMDRLTAYYWSGNARQLENEVKRLVASVRAKTITEEQITLQIPSQAAQAATEFRPEQGQSLFTAIDALERHMIQEALKQTGGNKLKAAQALGLSRQGLIKKLKKFDLRTPIS